MQAFMQSWYPVFWSQSEKEVSIEDPNLEKFAHFLGKEIQVFRKEMKDKFSKDDQSIFGTVDYLFKASTASLTAQYKTRPNPVDSKHPENDPDVLVLSSTLASDLNYANLTDDDLKKIANFLDEQDNFLPNCCVRLENTKSYHCMKVVDVVAKMEMNDDIAQIDSKELMDKMKLFTVNVAKVQQSFNLLLQSLPNSVQTPANLNSIIEPIPPEKAEPHNNISGQLILDKIKIFNQLFDSTVDSSIDPQNIQETFKTEKSFKIKDIGTDQIIIYNLGEKYIRLVGIIIKEFSFNYTKTFQDRFRQFCEENSSIIQPPGFLDMTVADEEAQKRNSLIACTFISTHNLKPFTLDKAMSDFDDSTLKLNNALR